MSGMPSDSAKPPVPAPPTTQQKQNAALALLTSFDERLNRAPDRWLYRAAAIATIFYALYVAFTSIVIPYWNYLLLLIPAGCIGVYIIQWKKDRYSFRLWHKRCALMLNVLLSLASGLFDVVQMDVNAKVQGVLFFVMAFAWFVLWCLSCYEGDRYSDELEHVQLEAIRLIIEGRDLGDKQLQLQLDNLRTKTSRSVDGQSGGGAGI